MRKKLVSFLKTNKKAQSIMEYSMIFVFISIPVMMTFIKIRNTIGNRAFTAIAKVAEGIQI